MSRKMTTDMFIAKANAVHDGFYDYSGTEYVDIKSPVTVTCPVHGSFTQLAETHLRGHGCPVCAVQRCRDTMMQRHGVSHAMQSDTVKAKSSATKMAKFGQKKVPGSGRRKMTKDEFVARARLVHGDRYDYTKSVIDGTQVKTEIVCPEHGPFMQTPAKHLKGRGCPHPDCINAKRVNTNMARFGASNVMQTEAGKKKQAKTVMDRMGVDNPMKSDAVKAKLKDTVKERYGVDCTLAAPEVREKIDATFKKRYGGRSPMCRQEAHDKARATMLEKYGPEGLLRPDMAGDRNPMRSSEVVRKVADSKAANNTFHTSKPEESLYSMLVKRFGRDDVVRQYTSPEYPYACDFYVKSRDMYVELNASWTHGGKWYEGSPDDMSKLGDWKGRGTKYYENAVSVWTGLDVRKRRDAEKVDLNYVVFWDNDLRDAEVWFSLGCPSGRDWSGSYSWLPERHIEGYDKKGLNLLVGNFSMIAKHYQFREFYKREIELWESNPIVRGLPLQVFLYHNRLKYLGKAPMELSDIELMRGIGIAGIIRSYTAFDAKLMKRVLDEYGVKSVYDPCAGWGERMLCCRYAGVRYLGVDVNAGLGLGYGDMVFGMGLSEQEFLVGDSSTVRLPDADFDAVITCPPYGDTEIYTERGAENLAERDFIAWWDSVVENSLSVHPRLFCFQVNQKWRERMSVPVLGHGFQLIDAMDAKGRSSHMTRRGGTDTKRERETMLVFQRV